MVLPPHPPTPPHLDQICSVMDLPKSSQAGADVNIWGRDRDGPGSVLEVAMKDYNSPVEVVFSFKASKSPSCD